jgi:hypothetical protein
VKSDTRSLEACRIAMTLKKNACFVGTYRKADYSELKPHFMRVSTYVQTNGDV